MSPIRAPGAARGQQSSVWRDPSNNMAVATGSEAYTSVTIVDLDAKAILGAIDVGSIPEDIAMTHGRAHVANSRPLLQSALPHPSTSKSLLLHPGKTKRRGWTFIGVYLFSLSR